MTLSLYDYDVDLYLKSHLIHESSMTHLQVFFILTPWPCHYMIRMLVWSPQTWVHQDIPASFYLYAMTLSYYMIRMLVYIGVTTYMSLAWPTCKFLSLCHDPVTIWFWCYLYWESHHIHESSMTYLQVFILTPRPCHYIIVMLVYTERVTTYMNPAWPTCKFLSLRHDPVTIWLWCWSISRESLHTWV